MLCQSLFLGVGFHNYEFVTLASAGSALSSTNTSVN